MGKILLTFGILTAVAGCTTSASRNPASNENTRSERVMQQMDAHRGNR